jgi:hypothetical protein
MRRTRIRILCAFAGVAAVSVAQAAVPVSPAIAATARVYAVVQEGLTAAQGQRLADAFAIPNAIQDDGAFEHVDAAGFQQAPSKVVGQGSDEAGRATVTQGLDLAALQRVQPISDADAISRGGRLVELAGIGQDGLTATPAVSHSRLTVSDQAGRVQVDQALDTTVSYRLSLGGLPTTGQGARLRVTFGPDGAVTQMSAAVRRLAAGASVPIIEVDEATRACADLYGPQVRQNQPTLAYQFPELTAQRASGQGSVRTIYPQYTCHSVDAQGRLLPLRLVPAVRGSGPSAGFTVKLSAAGLVTASASATGGASPYSFRWSSSTTALSTVESQGQQVSYQRRPRDTGEAGEQVVLEVTDANGLTATGSVSLGGPDTAQGTTVPGGGGFATFTVGPVDGGTETPVAEGYCGTASNVSADGFKAALTAHGVGIQFDWRGNSAWERDFKDPSRPGGDDSDWADDVDITWYSGHGSPGGFTFNTNQSDKVLTPADARWGNRDLEWLQLQSCNVLQDTTGTHDYFTRWGPAFAGLHLLNGYETLAGCVQGGLGGAFAKRLFASASAGPALTVRAAWAAAVIAKDPGRIYRSMGPLGSPVGGMYPWNYYDYFWGQGSTGPDIAGPVGFWALSGTS